MPLAGAAAKPRFHVRLGADTVANHPAQPLGHGEALGIRQMRPFVFLQRHALPALHQRHLIEREIKEGLLKLLPLDQGGSRHPTFYLYSNKEKPLGPATQILVELLRTFDTAPLEAPFAAPEQA